MNCSIEMEWKQNGTLPVYCHICTTAGLDAGMYTPSNLLKTATLPLLSKINTFPFECLKGRYRTCIKRKEGTHQTYVSTTSQHRKESVCVCVRACMCVRACACVCVHTMPLFPHVMAMMGAGSLSAWRHFFHMATAECTYRLQRAGIHT